MSIFTYLFIFACIYLFFRLFSRSDPTVVDEMEAVMNDDQYKVKGRFG